MSQSARDAFRRSLDDAKNADRVERRWMKGGRVTADNLKHGGGCVEKCSAKEWWEAARRKQDVGNARIGVGMAKAASAREWKPPKGRTMGFGKRKSSLMVDVYNEEPSYFNWCLENVSGFREKWNTLQKKGK